MSEADYEAIDHDFGEPEEVESRPKPLPTSRDVAERLCGISRNLDQPWALDRMASFIEAYVAVRVAGATRQEAKDWIILVESVGDPEYTERCERGGLQRVADLESALSAACERWETLNADK